MSFTEVLNELPALTFEQRQLLLSRVLEMDERPLAPEEEALIEERIEAHRQNPSSAVPMPEVKGRLQQRFPQ
jgi:hypothetical protein